MVRLRYIDYRKHLPSLTFIFLTLIALAAAGAVITYLGIYNIAADEPHNRLTYRLITTFRDQSIAARSQSISVPGDLSDPKRIASGAGLYAEMCSGCHLAPGMAKTEISQGLYPPAPLLSRGSDRTAAQQFWIIKHGIKMTAMPAWGKSHDDRLIWDMVAFVRQLPKLSPAQYQQTTQGAPMDHDAAMMDMKQSGSAVTGHAKLPAQRGH